MGKCYLLECAKCGYRAVVAGGFTEGNDVKAQTIRCRDCRMLHDSVVAIRFQATPRLWHRSELMPEEIRPTLIQALNRLPPSPTGPRRWEVFDPRCPMDASHRVEPWNTPGRCPRCRSFMERGALPYRLWD